MHKRLVIVATGLLLLAGSPVGAQVVEGVLHVNNTHMS
jgi:hypothetical protein